MPRFASETTVSVERSRAEIEGLLVRYGASEFHSGWTDGKAMVAFRLNDIFIRFVLPIPAKSEKRFWWKLVRGCNQKRSERQAEAAWEQECRQRWRALRLVVQAKLEAVECGISTLVNEFMAFIVLANDETLGDWVVDTAMPAIKAGRMPKMLAGHSSDPDVEDAEVIS